MADATEPTTPRPGTAQPRDAVPPMLPSRTAYLLSFVGVVLAGLLGGVIGYGIADVGSESDAALLIGTFLGSTIAASGVGIVAVLVLRAMAEWKQRPPTR